ncbi:MAG: hypothetical protein H6822_20310 [Planctomycetaceae bacterium]|nr:hypothetical protein [Planctomycetaceae bacterium]
MYFTQLVPLRAVQGNPASVRKQLKRQLESLNDTHIIFPFLNHDTLASIWPETSEIDSFIGAFSGSQTSVVAIPQRDRSMYYQAVLAINDILQDQGTRFVFELPAIVVILKDRLGGIVLPIAPLVDNDSVTSLVVNILQILEGGIDSLHGFENEVNSITNRSAARAVSCSTATKIHEVLYVRLASAIEDVAPYIQPGGSSRMDTEEFVGADGNDEQYVFRFNKGRWEIVFEGREIFLPDLKGLHYLRLLLSCPGRRQSVVDLMGGRDLTKVASTESLFDKDDQQVSRLLIGDATDIQAIKRYKELVGELDESICNAEQRGQAAEAVELNERKAKLIRYLDMAESQSKKSPETDKVRKSVYRCIESAIAKIEGLDRDFGRHLRNTITTGFQCCYDPEERKDWLT